MSSSNVTLLFHCNEEEVIIDLNVYANLNFKDFLDNIIISHANGERRYHLPHITINGENFDNDASSYNTVDIVNVGDRIEIYCNQSQRLQEALREVTMNGSDILQQLIYFTDRMEIPLREFTLTPGEIDRFREEVMPNIIGNEDVKVVISLNEFDKIGTIEPKGLLIGTCCAICQDDLSSGEKLKQLPEPCQHIFHNNCIKKWLTKESLLCPICKRPSSSNKVYLGVTIDNEELLAEIPSEGSREETEHIPIPNLFRIVTERGGLISLRDYTDEDEEDGQIVHGMNLETAFARLDSNLRQHIIL